LERISSPRLFLLLAAVGAKTKCIEIGAPVIDMRYESPIYMSEDAGPVRSGEQAPAIDFPTNATSRQHG